MKKTVLITGCSSGIGFALAKAFNELGYQVIATARQVESLKSLMQLGCETHSLDVANYDSRQALATQLSKRHLQLDILINNAGMSAMGPIVEVPEEKLHTQFTTNVIAPVMLVQTLLPLLRQSPQPMIVNIGSVSGVLTTPFAGAYCASKAALHSISEAMRLELAPLGIQVVTVQTGAIQSNFGQAALKGVKEWLSDQSLYSKIKKGILARANASQANATPTAEFAAMLAERLKTNQQRTTLPSTLNIGRGSRIYPFIARWLPESIRTRILSRRFGLHHLN